MTKSHTETIQRITTAACCGIAIGLAALLLQPKERDREKEIAAWVKHAEPEPRTFCPDISDRAFWEKTLADLKPSPPPTIPPQADAVALEKILHTGTEQELRFNDGKWLPTIDAALRQIARTPWTEAIQTTEFTDIQACQKAASLARTLYALKPKIEPTTAKLVTEAIHTKVTGPYLKDVRDMQRRKLVWGTDMCPWLEQKDNWTAVCVANILYATLAIEPDPEIRAHVIAASEDPLRDYFESFEDDGYLHSGIRYWNFGFGYYMLLGERLRLATKGKLDILSDPKIQRIGRFKDNWLVSKNGTQEFFPLFADNNNPIREKLWSDALANKNFGTTPPAETPIGEGGAVSDLTHWGNNGGFSQTAGTIKKADPIYYPSAGALLTKNRDTALAIQGGTNSGEHNHNDIGSYTVFENGAYITGDPGTVRYKIEDFGPARYKNEVQSSYGHPVPVINNHLQTNDPEAKGTVIKTEFSPETDLISYDISRAYKTPELINATRTVTVTKKPPLTITVTDAFNATHPITFESPVLTKGYQPERPPWEVESKGFLITFQEPEGLEITRSKVWLDGEPIIRTAATLKSRQKTGKITYTITQTTNGEP